MSALALAIVALVPSLADVNALVARGQAGRAYQRLTLDLDDGSVADDEGAEFWRGMLRYLRCAELDPPSRATSDPRKWAEARSLLDVELRRIARRRRDGRLSGPAAWLVEKRLDWSFATPAAAAGGSVIDWPVEDERWSDETPQIAAPEVRCVKQAESDAPPNPDDKKLVVEEAESARTLRLALAPGTPARAALLLDEAVLRARLEDWPEVWVVARLLEDELARPGAGPLSPGEQAQATLLAGLAAEHEGRQDDALARWTRAAALPLSDDERRFVDVHRQRLLVDAGRLTEARDVLDRYTNVPGDLGRYLRYRSALVRFRLGDEAALLAMARALLGSEGVAARAGDPVALAVEELAYLSLLRHPFDASVVEVVESLGVVRELPQRMDALGALAIERGRPALAVDVYRWLLEHHALAYARPYYLGRLAAAAAAQGDAATFTTSFTSLVEERLAPVPRGKAQRKSIEWDRQILLATRDAVTPLVARKDWAPLRTLVVELQKYLRVTRDRPPYAELTQLYRLASTQLPPSPRAYAERVGADHAPVFLGAVSVDRPARTVPEPELALPRLVGPVTLVCLPDGKGGCPRWLGPPPPSPSTASDKRAEVSHAR